MSDNNTSPTLRAYIVQKPKTPEGRSYWTEVGAVWPHKSGVGFDLVIPEGVSVTGRIVCIEPKSKPASE